jgi:hypothetical protein
MEKIVGSTVYTIALMELSRRNFGTSTAPTRRTPTLPLHAVTLRLLGNPIRSTTPTSLPSPLGKLVNNDGKQEKGQGGDQSNLADSYTAPILPMW